MSIPDILDKIIQIDEFKNFINLMDSPHVYPTITMYGYPWEKSKDWNDLISLLEQNKDFEKFNNKMQQLGSSANRVYLKDLAVWLIVRSYKVGVKQAIIEKSLVNAKAELAFQFERIGYFCKDNIDSSDDNLVFNRTISLRDTWEAKS